MTSTKPIKTKKIRLDQALVDRGLVSEIREARARILAGDVVVENQRVDKAGLTILSSAAIRLKDEGRFVSRGGDKLFAASEDFGLLEEFKGKIVLDVGASTGGFTDCCLQLGAIRAYAVDVGTNQLAWSLRQDPRVISHEKTDIRDFSPPEGLDIDWVVADVSFTSLTRLLDKIIEAAPRAKLLLLVKPQFELPRDLIPAGGVVVDDNDRLEAVLLVENTLKAKGFVILNKKDARIEGRAGNREIFIHAIPGP